MNSFKLEKYRMNLTECSFCKKANINQENRGLNTLPYGQKYA